MSTQQIVDELQKVYDEAVKIHEKAARALEFPAKGVKLALLLEEDRRSFQIELAAYRALKDAKKELKKNLLEV